MGTQTDTNSRGRGGSYDFTPIECDVNEIAPEAAEGVYNSVIDEVRVQPTSKDKYPMLVIDWRLDNTETETEEAKKSEGATLTDFIAFFPDGDKRGNFPKRRWRQLRELLDLSDDLVPTRMERKSDFDDLIEALKGKEAKIFVTMRKDKETGEDRPTINYAAPRGSLGAMPSLDDDDDNKGRRSSGSSKSKPAAKPAKRR